MTSGGKLLLGLLAIGGIGAFVFSSGKASAAPAPAPNPFPPLPTPGTLPNLFPPGVTPLPNPLQPSGGAPVIPPPGTPIPLPGGGSIPVPVIPGINTPSQVQPAAPLPSLPSIIANLPPIPAGVVPSIPGPAPSPAAPPASPAEIDSTAPADTIALVAKMLAQEANPHWRIIPEPLLVAWQKARGLTPDGDFGTGGALRMAQEIGTIPIIRGWPKGSFPSDGKLATYRASLQQIANSAPEPRASQLRAAAARELGQGYGTPETPIAHLITIQSA